jgi:hypothetical protein
MAAGAYNQPPVRTPAGATSDQVWQPLADCGAGNPAFYHTFFDDMDSSLSVTGVWTQTKTSAGTIANLAGDGGLGLFTTNASTPLATDIASIQLGAANFSLTAGQKLFFETRFKTSDWTNAEFVFGLIQTTTTPFTVTDGIYFQKLTGGTVLTLNSAVGSTITSVTVPAATQTFTNNTNLDFAFYLNRQGDILAFCDDFLVGFLPQSGTGIVSPPNAGAVARITAPTLTAVNLNPTFAIRSGTASSKTATLDYIGAMKER